MTQTIYSALVNNPTRKNQVILDVFEQLRNKENQKKQEIRNKEKEIRNKEKEIKKQQREQLLRSIELKALVMIVEDQKTIKNVNTISYRGHYI